MREHRKMTLKRIGIGILCMVFVLSMLAPLVAFAEEKTESGSQVSKRELAYIQISVGDGQETPVFKAGQKVSEFRINVKNNGNVDAHNVRIEPDIKNASDWPFELDKLNYEKELSTIKSGGQTAAVWGSEEKPLIVRGDVTGKSYKLEFKISYDDGEKSYETDKYVFVKTTAKEKPSENQGGNANGGEINHCQNPEHHTEIPETEAADREMRRERRTIRARCSEEYIPAIRSWQAARQAARMRQAHLFRG